MRPIVRKRGFTMIELMIVVAIIAIVITIAFTVWRRAREVTRARSCQENLAKIEHAKDQYAFENSARGTATPAWNNLVGRTLYLKRAPTCPANGTYTVNQIDSAPTCSYSTPDWLDAKFDHVLQTPESSE